MSVACQKNLSLTVNAAVLPDLYWTLDEASGNRVDKIKSLALVPTAGGGAGFAILGASPGLFSNGVRFQDAVGFQTNTLGVTAEPKLAYAGNGFSWCGWFKINSESPLGNEMTINYASFAAFSFAIRFMRVANPGHIELFGFDNAVGTFDVDVPYTLGAWTFFHLFFDPVLTQFGWSFNNGAPAFSAAGMVVAATANGIFFMNGPGSSGPAQTTDVVVDEFALKITRMFTPAEVSFLYNGGAGRTYPF